MNDVVECARNLRRTIDTLSHFFTNRCANQTHTQPRNTRTASADKTLIHTATINIKTNLSFAFRQASSLSDLGEGRILNSF